MADYRGHINGAALGAIAYTGIVTYGVSVSGVADSLSAPDWLGYALVTSGIGMLFGLWPDVDINSHAQKIFYRLFLGIDLVLIVLRNFEAAAYLGLFAILPALGKHRGWTHTHWAMFLVPLPFLVLPYITNFHLLYRPMVGWLFYGAAVTGYASHLWMDGLLFSRNKKRSKKSLDHGPLNVRQQFTEDVSRDPRKAGKRLGSLIWEVMGLSARAALYFFFRPFLRK